MWILWLLFEDAIGMGRLGWRVFADTSLTVGEVASSESAGSFR